MTPLAVTVTEFSYTSLLTSPTDYLWSNASIENVAYTITDVAICSTSFLNSKYKYYTKIYVCCREHSQDNNNPIQTIISFFNLEGDQADKI